RTVWRRSPASWPRLDTRFQNVRPAGPWGGSFQSLQGSLSQLTPEVVFGGISLMAACAKSYRCSDHFAAGVILSSTGLAAYSVPLPSLRASTTKGCVIGSTHGSA